MATEIWQVKISQLNEIVDWQNSYTIVTDKNGQSVKAPLSQVSKIGDLSQLGTVAKNTLVAAINEVLNAEPDVPTISTNIATDKASNAKTVSPKAVVDYAGDLDNLQTSAKTTLVAAINEAATTGNVTVDSSLSSTSENPVQNKVINSALAGKQETLVGSGTGQNIKTINNESLLGTGNIEVEGHDGVGFDSISTPSPADGTAIITLTNGDTITLDLNHDHTAYPKYQLLNTESDYNNLQTKDSGTLYLIKESQS